MRAPRSRLPVALACLAFVLALVLALAPALAQSSDGTAPPASDNASTDALPVGGAAPGPEESRESGAGLGYGFAVLLGTIAFLGLLGVLSYRYSRRKR